MSRKTVQGENSYKSTERSQAHSKQGHRGELVVGPFQDRLSQDLLFEVRPLSESTCGSSAIQTLAWTWVLCSLDPSR